MKYIIIKNATDWEDNQYCEVVDNKVYTDKDECLLAFRELAMQYSGYSTEENIEMCVKSLHFAHCTEDATENYKILNY